MRCSSLFERKDLVNNRVENPFEYETHHPTIFLFYNMRAMLGPAPGHHGFPGMGASHVVAYLQCTARAHTICFRWVPVSLAASRQV